jgi:3-hydroxyacyl-CoA dehydrogenase/enoyl-CoA hydratase/3-hydroxybutyryl-CoA epimerase
MRENLAKVTAMTATETGSMIRRENGPDGVCTLTFDRPNSGANIFDAATIESLREHLDAIESDSSIKGVIVTSAKKSIFIAGADLQTLLRQAQTGELRAFIAEGQKHFQPPRSAQSADRRRDHGACAGGGYEITLQCDHRVASNDPATRIGLARNDARARAGVGWRDETAAAPRSRASRGCDPEGEALFRRRSAQDWPRG